MNEKRNFNYKRLHPFKWYILENFPFLEDSIDVLTNYQLFCKLGEMYNKEVDAINTLGIQVEGLTDWFDDLDLQEEVNNKLDEMAESGELAEIIAQYIQLNGVLVYDTIAEMKNATNLVDGSVTKTLGFYSVNDGGGATYKIRNITNDDVVDNMFIIALENDETLIAELITINVNIKQLGARGSQSYDDSSYITQSINKLSYAYIPDGIFYANLSFTSDINCEIYGDKNSILKSFVSGTDIIEINVNEITNLKSIHDLTFELANNDIGISIKLPSFIDNYYPNIIELKNIHINCENSFSGNAIELDYLREFNIENITVKRDRGDDSSRTGNGLLLKSCMNLQIINSSFGFLNNGIKIENDTMSSEGIKIDKTEFFYNNNGVNAQSSSSRAILDLRIENCMVDQIQQNGFLLDGVTSSSVSNCWLGNNVSNSQGIYIKSTNRENAFLNIINNTFFMNLSTDAFAILLENNSSYNIRNTIISNNEVYNYKNYAFKILGLTAIRNLNISNNNFESSSGESNAPLNYETLPINTIITSNYNGGAIFRDNELDMYRNINMFSYKEISITTGQTIQNNSNRPLQVFVNAKATTSGTKGRLVLYLGTTQANVQEKGTQIVAGDTADGVMQSFTFTIPPKYYYAINPSATATISSAFGIYM